MRVLGHLHFRLHGRKCSDSECLVRRTGPLLLIYSFEKPCVHNAWMGWMGWIFALLFRGGVLVATISAVTGKALPLQLWPRPKRVLVDEGAADHRIQIDPCMFSLQVTKEIEHFLGEKLARRAWELYKPHVLHGLGTSACFPSQTQQQLQYLYLSFEDTLQDEAYRLEITAERATVYVSSYVAILRALETFSQLIIVPDQTTCKESCTHSLWLSPVTIQDSPTFEHRGVLVDLARNFIPINSLERVIDGLMFSKMNVLHMHLSDSQSFPFQLTTGHGPNITQNGAYSSNETYTIAAINDLRNYAESRGVKLLPEIDTPGHARAFGLSPELTSIVSCANVPGASYSTCCSEPPCGQLNPSSDLMYSVLSDALSDVVDTFSDSEYLHLGFDEVNDNCWASDPSVAAYLKSHNLTMTQLLEEFFLRERDLVKQAVKVVYWDEVVTSGLHKKLQPGDVVQFWHAAGTGLISTFMKETPTTNRAILSAYTSYYLDCGMGNEFGQNSWCDPYKTWRAMFFNDPLKGPGLNATQLIADGRILGGEAAMWTETTSAGSLDAKLWPRAAAYGGRLWEYQPGGVRTSDWVNVELSLAAHSTRLLERGVQADQIMPYFCQLQPHMCFDI